MTIKFDFPQGSFLFNNYCETVELLSGVWTPRTPRDVLNGASGTNWEMQEGYPLAYLEFVEGSFIPVWDEEDIEPFFQAKVGDIFHFHGTYWDGDCNRKVLAVRLKDGWHMGQVTHDHHHLAVLGGGEVVDISHLMNGTKMVTGETFNGSLGREGVYGKVFITSPENEEEYIDIPFISAPCTWRSGDKYVPDEDVFPTHTEEQLRELFLREDCVLVEVRDENSFNGSYTRRWERKDKNSWVYTSWQG